MKEGDEVNVVTRNTGVASHTTTSSPKLNRPNHLQPVPEVG